MPPSRSAATYRSRWGRRQSQSRSGPAVMAATPGHRSAHSTTPGEGVRGSRYTRSSRPMTAPHPASVTSAPPRGHGTLARWQNGDAVSGVGAGTTGGDGLGLWRRSMSAWAAGDTLPDDGLGARAGRVDVDAASPVETLVGDDPPHASPVLSCCAWGLGRGKNSHRRRRLARDFADATQQHSIHTTGTTAGAATRGRATRNTRHSTRAHADTQPHR